MKESGIGRENGIEALEACESHFALVNSIGLNTSSRLAEQIDHRERVVA